jgi:hypothetical protein
MDDNQASAATKQPVGAQGQPVVMKLKEKHGKGVRRKKVADFLFKYLFFSKNTMTMHIY